MTWVEQLPPHRWHPEAFIVQRTFPDPEVAGATIVGMDFENRFRCAVCRWWTSKPEPGHCLGPGGNP